MAEIWTQPKSWQLNDVYDATEMNVQMRDNLEYLYRRPTVFQRFTDASAVDLYASLVGWKALTAYDLQIDTESGRLMYDFSMPLLPTTAAARIINLDVLFVEANVWLSSGTSTQYTDGATSARTSTNTVGLNPRVFGIVELSAGLHTARLYLKSNVVGINTIPNILYMPTVREL